MRVLSAFHLIAFVRISAHLAIRLKRVSFVSNIHIVFPAPEQYFQP